MPDFASQDYWQNRFQGNSTPFDWLIPATVFNDIIAATLGKEELHPAEVLHIGCGTAESSALRKLVRNPEQIHNVDYSSAAIDAGAAREREHIGSDELKQNSPQAKHDSVQTSLDGNVPNSRDEKSQLMRWSCVDLLSLGSTLSLLAEQAGRRALYDLVLDKSTSDSISCGPDVSVELPYLLSVNGWSRGTLGSGVREVANVHPLHVLAVHLAALTKPTTGRWIVVSYSDDRFPFLPPYPHSPSHGLLLDDIVRKGFPHPNQLWKLERKEKLDLAVTETLSERKKRLSSGIVHRPQISHWLYILARTDVVITD